MDIKNIIGICAGVLTAVSAIPQILKVIKDKKASAISPLMFWVLLAGNSLWCWYGILLNEWPIIITNAFSIVCDILMIILNYRYSRSSK
jgi:MtN3 and saliva related transmembrane protein